MKRLFMIPALAASLLMTGCGGDSSNLPSLDYAAVKTSKDAKWGFVGPDGKMLYEDEFENEPSVVANGYFTVEENNGICVYKVAEKKPELVPGLEDLVCAGTMSEGLIPMTRKNERIKLVDASGKEKVTFMPVDGNEIVKVSGLIIDGLLTFKTTEDKWGIISKDGDPLIAPKYDQIYYAMEGMVFAKNTGKPDKEGNIKDNYYLLDKKGKEILKFKDEMSIASAFRNGKALVMKGSEKIPGYINKKGEFTKLPGKVHSFGGFFNGKEFSFETEDDKVGVMNLEGEIIIRPRYDYLGTYGEDKFYVKDGDKKWSILNKSGEKEKSFDDFEYFIAMPQVYKNTKFEVLAREKDHQFDFYTFDGKPVTQESFYAVNVMLNSGMVETDYFNAEEVGNKMAALINDNGVKGIAFNTEISKLLPEDADAEDYSGKYNYQLPGIHGGYKWDLSVIANADTQIASPEYTTKTETYWFSTYTRQVISGYHFNPAKVISFVIKAESSKEFAEKAAASVVADLKKRGFKEGKASENTIALLSKGDISVSIAKGNDDNKELYLFVSNDKPQVESSSDAVPNDSVAAVNIKNTSTETTSGNSSTSSDYLNLVTKKRLTADDLKGYTKAQLRLMRNTVYAAHGRKFKSADLQKYFSQFSWYKPTVNDVSLNALSDIEKANVTLIQKYE